MSTPELLVAHFDPGERTRLAAILRDAGATVTEVVDGSTALELAGSQRFDLLIATCMLSGVSGFELCRRLQVAEGPRAAVPTLLVADADDPYVRARARHVGAKRVLFGSPTTIELRELLASDWNSVDPLELSSRTPAGAKNDRLIRDVLDGTTGEDSMMSRVTDPLTGLVQRDFLALKVEEECKRSARYGQPLSLVALEIASFDQLVERHGKTTGDEAILELAGVLLCESRDVDVAGRAATARFHMLLPATPIEGARVVAERIRESLAGRKLAVESGELPLKVRIGVATVPGGTRQTAEELVREADADLASAELSPDGRGLAVRGGKPVEPLVPKARKPTRTT